MPLLCLHHLSRNLTLHQSVWSQRSSQLNQGISASVPGTAHSINGTTDPHWRKMSWTVSVETTRCESTQSGLHCTTCSVDSLFSFLAAAMVIRAGVALLGSARGGKTVLVTLPNKVEIPHLGSLHCLFWITTATCDGVSGRGRSEKNECDLQMRIWEGFILKRMGCNLQRTWQKKRLIVSSQPYLQSGWAYHQVL